jgi:hypothetical protein
VSGQRPAGSTRGRRASYAAITESADRRWTFRLIDRLTAPDLSEAERPDLVEALAVVSDRRAVPVLERVLTDRARPSRFARPRAVHHPHGLKDVAPVAQFFTDALEPKK